MIRFPKLKVSPRLFRIAYHFFDLEAGELSPDTRSVEYSWVLMKLKSKNPGKVLDVGCTGRFNYLPIVLAHLGWQVYGLDLREFKFKHPNFIFCKQDIRKTTFPGDFFDSVYAVSTLEHIGLSGRFGIIEDDLEGDVKAVKEIHRILCTSGIFLVTLPYGQRAVIRPFNRVYDKLSLRTLFIDWEVRKQFFYFYNSEGYLMHCPEQIASQAKSSSPAITLLELRPMKTTR